MNNPNRLKSISDVKRILIGLLETSTGETRAPEKVIKLKSTNQCFIVCPSIVLGKIDTAGFLIFRVYLFQLAFLAETSRCMLFYLLYLTFSRQNVTSRPVDAGLHENNLVRA